MLIFTAVIVQYKKMHGIGTCTRVFLKCMYEHLVLCIDVINSNGACLSEPRYWFLLGTVQGANISNLWEKKHHRLESYFCWDVCFFSLEGKTWVDWRISYRLSFCWSLVKLIWKDWNFWSNFPVCSLYIYIHIHVGLKIHWFTCGWKIQA